MNKEQEPNHISSENNSKDSNSSKSMNTAYGNIHQEYLPKVRTDYTPTNESVESATGVDFPINMPNPAVDSIAVNNIAYGEFDYTEDMLFPDDYNLDRDTDKVKE